MSSPVTELEFKIGLSDSDKAAMQAAITALVKANLITAYSSSATYALGDFVYYDGKFYKCVTATTTAGPWTSAHWSEATLNDVINAVNAAVASVNNKVNPDDICPELRAGYAFTADNLNATKGLTVNDDPMSFGMVGGAQKSAVGDGNATLNKLVCVDVVRNQILHPLSSTYWNAVGGTATYSDGVATFTASEQNGSLRGGSYVIVGHSYLVRVSVKATNGATYKISWQNNSVKFQGEYTGNGSWQTYFFVANASETYYALLIWDTRASNWDAIQVKDAYINGITRRYGNNDVVNAIIGTDASTQVARLLAFDPEILSDTDYDAGTLVPSKTAKLLPVGVNQWDEEWEIGQYSTSTGEPQANSLEIRSKNPIKVLPNTSYYFLTSGKEMVILFYDESDELISTTSTYGGTKTTPSNCRAIKFFMAPSYGTTYNNDICINISDPNINGKYYPPKRNPVTLPNYEGHGILKVVDGKVVADGTELYPDGNSKKRYATYTFTGNETVTPQSANRFSILLNNYLAEAIKGVASDSDVANLRISGLVTVAKGGVASNQYQCGLEATSANNLFIYLTSTATAEDVKSFLTGKTIVYELATEEDITTDGFQSTFPVEQGGTLQFLDEDDNPIAGLQGSEIFYQKNIKAFVEALGEATDWDPDRIKRLGNLSFTPEYDDISLSPTPVGAYARAQVYNATFTIVISASFSGTANGSITMQDSVIDLSTEFPNTKPAEKIIDADGKPASEAPTTPDCPIAYFVGRTKEGTLRWCLLHSAANEIKVHFEEPVPLDASGNGIIDCRASLIL